MARAMGFLNAEQGPYKLGDKLESVSLTEVCFPPHDLSSCEKRFLI